MCIVVHTYMDNRCPLRIHNYPSIQTNNILVAAHTRNLLALCIQLHKAYARYRFPFVLQHFRTSFLRDDVRKKIEICRKRKKFWIREALLLLWRNIRNLSEFLTLSPSLHIPPFLFSSLLDEPYASSPLSSSTLTPRSGPPSSTIRSSHRRFSRNNLLISSFKSRMRNSPRPAGERETKGSNERKGMLQDLSKFVERLETGYIKADSGAHAPHIH